MKYTRRLYHCLNATLRKYRGEGQSIHAVTLTFGQELPGDQIGEVISTFTRWISNKSNRIKSKIRWQYYAEPTPNSDSGEVHLHAIFVNADRIIGELGDQWRKIMQSVMGSNYQPNKAKVQIGLPSSIGKVSRYWSGDTLEKSRLPFFAKNIGFDIAGGSQQFYIGTSHGKLYPRLVNQWRAWAMAYWDYDVLDYDIYHYCSIAQMIYGLEKESIRLGMTPYKYDDIDDDWQIDLDDKPDKFDPDESAILFPGIN